MTCSVMFSEDSSIVSHTTLVSPSASDSVEGSWLGEELICVVFRLRTPQQVLGTHFFSGPPHSIAHMVSRYSLPKDIGVGNSILLHCFSNSGCMVVEWMPALWNNSLTSSEILVVLIQITVTFDMSRGHDSLTSQLPHVELVYCCDTSNFSDYFLLQVFNLNMVGCSLEEN